MVRGVLHEGCCTAEGCTERVMMMYGRTGDMT